ncbi:MAG: HAD family phosphatase [Clostridia bacterium]|nr:HAD family phosphatase [Clostridia bacterium]
MQAYKILSTDLDGTLFNERGTISAENNAAIKEMTERGVLVVPNSGRTLAEMPREIKEHPHFRYLIHSDGATVYDKETGERIKLCMPKAVSDKVFDILARYRVSVSVRQSGICYVKPEAHNDADYAAHGVSNGWRDYFYEIATPTPFDFFREPDTAVEMFCAFFADMEERAACTAQLLETGEVQVASTAPNNIEVFWKHAGKGSAILALAARCGIDPAATIAVGDSTNDSDMIVKAGLGLAMENACDELKALADTVICHHRDHAMVYILEHYLK